MGYRHLPQKKKEVKFSNKINALAMQSVAWISVPTWSLESPGEMISHSRHPTETLSLAYPEGRRGKGKKDSRSVTV